MSKMKAGQESFEKAFQELIAETLKADSVSDGAKISEAAQELLDAGIPIYYSDDAYPGETVKEYPDGHREIVDRDANYKEFVVRKLQGVRGT